MAPIATSRYELSDEQWKQIEALFPTYTTGRPSKRNNHEMFNSTLWIARSGEPWPDLPERYDFWKTAYARFCKWRNDGTLLLIFQALQIEPDVERISASIRQLFAHTNIAQGEKMRLSMRC